MTRQEALARLPTIIQVLERDRDQLKLRAEALAGSEFIANVDISEHVAAYNLSIEALKLLGQAPAAPWPAGGGNNAKREGWKAFFAGKGREECPFPPGRADLQRGYREGWDAAGDLRSTLIAVAEFLEEEAENRSAAGSAMSDYEREPRELAERVRAMITEAQ
jgi:ribosome modulation factor